MSKTLEEITVAHRLWLNNWSAENRGTYFYQPRYHVIATRPSYIFLSVIPKCEIIILFHEYHIEQMLKKTFWE